MGIFGLLTTVKYIIAGLHIRYAWPNTIPSFLMIPSALLAASGFALVTWSMASNPFFSQVVRIQAERGHSVAGGGPYRYIRHPGYLGTLTFELGTGILLGSLWAFFIGLAGAMFIIIRTAKEDRMLQEELADYVEYTKNVKHRLFRGIW